MRILATVLTMLLATSMAGTVWGDENLNGSVRSGDPNGTTIEGRRDFIEGWNVDVPFDGSWHWGAACQGPVYVAGATYYLDRIEFMAGELAGPASIEVREDDGSGCPTGAVLASGSFMQEVTLGWQGADLTPAVLIEAGETYHINYHVVVDSPSSFALGGAIIPHCWSWECVSWEGPASSFYWMAKFFGSYDPTPVDASSWGRVRSLYR